MLQFLLLYNGTFKWVWMVNRWVNGGINIDLNTNRTYLDTTAPGLKMPAGKLAQGQACPTMSRIMLRTQPTMCHCTCELEFRCKIIEPTIIIIVMHPLNYVQNIKCNAELQTSSELCVCGTQWCFSCTLSPGLLSVFGRPRQFNGSQCSWTFFLFLSLDVLFC